MDAIGSAILMVYDCLKDDKQSKSIIKKLDTAKTDVVIKTNLKEGIKRLRELEKSSIADDLEKKLKGFI
jgi:hypothetical protein